MKAQLDRNGGSLDQSQYIDGQSAKPRTSIARFQNLRLYFICLKRNNKNIWFEIFIEYPANKKKSRGNFQDTTLPIFPKRKGIMTEVAQCRKR